ncbi:hypothetical protein PCASD_03488 [Puccinia coronata f. sp. avenae]|uniref:Endonuclease/exonuclease/phosphatase domain-containing protein n=1 Tax=Puccinia coronata f. sp. avenae TaxID=200324 RepID=A0A2N5V7K5_9BASI|nr:hypothetical protein PCASD_03488 [Puccinia coronata f. sp. avenae]
MFDEPIFPVSRLSSFAYLLYLASSILNPIFESTILNHSTHSGTQVHLTGDGEAPWLTRLPFIMDQVRWESPDIIGFQEVLEHQYRDLKNETALRDYTSIGVGRDDGITRGEYVPLFWKNDKFKALSVKHFWLSDQPDVPGSIGWDAGQPRMVTMVHLKPVSDTSRDGESTESFFVMNTHFDDRGLQESAKLILKKSNELIAETGLPILLMGDFNAPRQEAAYKVLTGKASEQASGQPTEHFSQDCAMRIERPYSMPQGICIEGEHKAHNEQIPAVTSSNSTAQHFKDSGAEVKRPYGSFEATFTGFYHNPKDAQVIDFIMFMPTAPNLWQVIKYGVIPNQFYNEPLASDHRMVSAVIQTA